MVPPPLRKSGRIGLAGYNLAKIDRFRTLDLYKRPDWKYTCIRVFPFHAQLENG